MFAQIFKKDFVGEKVPRDADGKWTKLRFEKDKGFVGHDKPLTSAQQEQLKKVGPIPPAWTDVHLNPDAKGATQVKGRDAKGKQQIKQHPDAIEANAGAKWARGKEFHKTAVVPIMKAALKTMQDKNATPRERDLGAVIHLISKTGFRIGGSDTGAEEQAYGASTLQKKHIKVKGDKIDFNFTGKSGVTQQKSITDPALAAHLRTKLPSLKPTDQVFASSDADARTFIKKAAGNDKFKVKDFRTWHGTGLALALSKAMKPPKTTKEYADQQKQIAVAVSKHLGNTPTVALSSYIAPAVFAKWDPALAPKKKVKKFEAGFAEIFRVMKDDMTPFDDIYAAWDDAVDDDDYADPEDSGPFDDGAVDDGSMKPLYVCRPVINAKEIISWAKGQRFETTLLPEDMHATICYSKEPMDWSAPGESVDKITVRGGERSVAPLGDKGAVVLKFSSNALQARWKEFQDAGASFDYPTFQPHISISYDAKDVDLTKVEPYAGPIVFGPEKFQEISKPKIVEKDDIATVDLASAGLKTAKPKKLKKVWNFSEVFKDSAASLKAWLSREHSKFKAYDNKSKAMLHTDALGQTYYKLRAAHGKESPEAQAAYTEWKKSKVHLVANHGVSNGEIANMTSATQQKFKQNTGYVFPVQSTAKTPAAPAVKLTAGQKAAQTKKNNQLAAAAKAAQAAHYAKYTALSDLKTHAATEDSDVTAAMDLITAAKKAGATNSEINDAVVSGTEALNAKKLLAASAKAKPVIVKELSVKDSLKAAHLASMQALSDAKTKGMTQSGYAEASAALKAAIAKATESGMTQGQLNAMKAVASTAFNASKKGLVQAKEHKLDVPPTPIPSDGFSWVDHDTIYKLQEKAGAVISTFDDATKNAIIGYTGSGYQTINQQQAISEEAAGKRAKLLHAALDNQLGVSVKLRRNMAQKRLWEALGLPTDSMDYSDAQIASVIGKTYREPVFSSTSYDKDVTLALTSLGQKTGLMELNINAPAHTKGLLITSLSSHHSEKEVLLQKGATYIVRKIERHPLDNGQPGSFKYKVHVDWIGTTP